MNQSRGGDTTITMAPRFAPQGAPDPKVRYLLPANPGYVVIGLSLANEGIFEAATKQEKDAVFKQYADGIKGFVDRPASTTSYRWWRSSIRATLHAGRV